MAKSSNKFTCLICGEKKPRYQSIKHRNENVDSNFGFCKDCVAEIIDSKDDPDGAIEMMRMLNIPFVVNIWNRSKEDSPNNPIGKYLQLIAPKKAYKTFLDSDFGKEVKESNIKITDDIVARWGSGENWNEEKYIEYEMSLEDLKRIKMPSTPLEEKRYVENVRLGKRLSEEIEDGKATDIKALKAAYSQDLKELGLDVESIAQDDHRTLGTRIRDFEKNEPLPEIAEEFKDVDRIKPYFAKYFVTTIKKIFNMATEKEINDLYDIDQSINPDNVSGKK